MGRVQAPREQQLVPLVLLLATALVLLPPHCGGAAAAISGCALHDARDDEQCVEVGSAEELVEALRGSAATVVVTQDVDLSGLAPEVVEGLQPTNDLLVVGAAPGATTRLKLWRTDYDSDLLPQEATQGLGCSNVTFQNLSLEGFFKAPPAGEAGISQGGLTQLLRVIPISCGFQPRRESRHTYLEVRVLIKPSEINWPSEKYSLTPRAYLVEDMRLAGPRSQSSADFLEIIGFVGDEGGIPADAQPLDLGGGSVGGFAGGFIPPELPPGLLAEMMEMGMTDMGTDMDPCVSPLACGSDLWFLDRIVMQKPETVHTMIGTTVLSYVFQNITLMFTDEDGNVGTEPLSRIGPEVVHQPQCQTLGPPAGSSNTSSARGQAQTPLLGADYRGSLNVTASGRPCRPWREVLIPGSGVDFSALVNDDPQYLDGNYCRNPAAHGGVWCFVEPIPQEPPEGIPGGLSPGFPGGLPGLPSTSPAWVEWEYCEVPVCEERAVVNCMHAEDHGTSYSGDISVSAEGLECMPWSGAGESIFGLPSSPELPSACRNPGGAMNVPWCFVSDYRSWRSCDIPVCRAGGSGNGEAGRNQQALIIGGLSALGLVLVLLVALVGGLYVWRHRSDHSWKIKRSELTYTRVADTGEIEVLGQGANGLVLKGEFRGTAVAVKRVLPQTMAGKATKNHVNFDAVAMGSASMDGSATRISVLINDRSSITSTNSILPLSLNSATDSNTERGFESSRTSRQHRKASTKAFMSEMQIMVYLRHPCITTIMGAVVDGEADPLLVMEYMEHRSLLELLQSVTVPLTAELALGALRDVASGMAYMDSSDPPILHNDLKSGNVLIDGKFRAKITDFGSSKRSNANRGTPYWMAPELIRSPGSSSCASDVYAMGILINEVFTRKMPYDGEAPELVVHKVADASRNPPYRPRPPDDIPDDVLSLMTDCWATDPAARPTFSRIAERLAEIREEDLNAFFTRMSTHAGGGRSAVAATLEEHPRMELMHRVFPPHIAKVLERGGKVEPEHHKEVTIFFSDIVGFTDISRQLQAIDVMDMLDRLYLAFDTVASKHNIFKVETIGDAYMAAANLASPQPDGALRICRFALDVLDAARQVPIKEDEPELGNVVIRAGLHTGPVVASVVGKLNPRFCLFGDTVNTASRMESNSVASCLHASADFAKSLAKSQLLDNSDMEEFSIIPRGKIPIKGKGIMRTFWVERGSAPLQDASKSFYRKERNRALPVRRDNSWAVGGAKNEETALLEAAPAASSIAPAIAHLSRRATAIGGLQEQTELLFQDVEEV